MVFKFLLGSALLSIADAKNWALLVTGSKTYDNYRHQADLCHAYQILVSKGFSKDRIITMAFDDIADHELNPFPGKVFNSPTPAGTEGVDVYNGCDLDYTGADVTVDNFVNLLLGNGATGGNGRTLDTTADDDLTVIYFDHGAPGLIQFPDGDILHASDFQTMLTTMHDTNRYGRMVIYIEACESGSMLNGLRDDLNIYGVTAVGVDNPSLGTYCGYQAVVDGTKIGSCLGDLFAVFWMKFVADGDGSNTLNSFFTSVYDDVASYAALHYGHELNQQYGDLTMGKLTVGDFFYGDSQSDIKLASPFKSPWVAPDEVYAAPRLAMDAKQIAYSEASAQPTFFGEAHWRAMLKSTDDLQALLTEQRETQRIHWELVWNIYPNRTDAHGAYLPDDKMYHKRMDIWTTNAKPLNPECERKVHVSLVDNCASSADLTTSYALQFHQVVVNLCDATREVSTDPRENLTTEDILFQIISPETSSHVAVCARAFQSSVIV